MTLFLLTAYILGSVLCGCLIFKIYHNPKRDKETNFKTNIIEVFFCVYLIILSWVGVFSLLAGALTYMNSDYEEDKKS